MSYNFVPVDPERKCPDNNKCEQLCALDVGSSLEMCSCYSGYALDSNKFNCTGKDIYFYNYNEYVIMLQCNITNI